MSDSINDRPPELPHDVENVGRVPPAVPPADWPGDVASGDEALDPGQQAMHGLLSAYFDAENSDRNERADAILARLGIQPCGTGVSPVAAGDAAQPSPAVPALLLIRLRGLVRRKPLRRLALPAALAAAIIILLGLFWHSTPKAMADIYADAANAGTAMFYFLRDSVALFNNDPQAAEGFQQAIEESRRKRDQAQAEIASSREAANLQVVNVLHSWQGLYCGLRELGEIDKAISENRAAIAWLAERHASEWSKCWEWILLDGLGNTYAMCGDYAAARKAYTESLDLRHKSIGSAKDPHRGEAGYEGHLADTLVIPYLRMVVLCIAADNLNEADEWLGLADKTLRQQFSTICELNGSKQSASASAWDAWIALPDEFRWPHDPYTPEQIDLWPPAWRIYRPNEGHAQRMGAILYHRAILLRLKGDNAAAAAALDRAAILEPFLTRNPRNDEYRLPFVLRLERARLAIITGRHDRALRHLDEADAYIEAVKKHFADIDSGEKEGDRIPDVNKLPIGPSCRAEMQLLRGVALLGQDPESEEGINLVQKALAIPEKLATDLPAEQKDIIMKQFEAWQRLVNTARPASSQQVFN